jgi:hypothetical protein
MMILETAGGIVVVVAIVFGLLRLTHGPAGRTRP